MAIQTNANALPSRNVCIAQIVIKHVTTEVIFKSQNSVGHV